MIFKIIIILVVIIISVIVGIRERKKDQKIFDTIKYWMGIENKHRKIIFSDKTAEEKIKELQDECNTRPF